MAFIVLSSFLMRIAITLDRKPQQQDRSFIQPFPYALEMSVNLFHATWTVAFACALSYRSGNGVLSYVGLLVVLSFLLDIGAQLWTRLIAWYHPAELVYFYSRNCPKCQAIEGPWQDMVARLQNQEVEGYRVQFVAIDCTDENKPEVKEMFEAFEIFRIPKCPAFVLFRGENGIAHPFRDDMEIEADMIETYLRGYLRN